MACRPLIAGERLLSTALDHLDCQAQLLGSLGYQTLGTPGSIASGFLTGLLTLMVAYIGFRMLFDFRAEPRNLVIDFIKIGIVLTLAYSWPAYQTVIRNVVVTGPSEIASSIASANRYNGERALVRDLQSVDQSIFALRKAFEQAAASAAPSRDQEAVEVADPQLLEKADELGWVRTVWLGKTIGVFGMLRFVGGLLLALGPLAAGLLLFGATSGLFSGWFRGLVFVVVASVATGILLAVEVFLVEPWFAQAYSSFRQGRFLTIDPRELFAINFAFLMMQLGVLWLLGKVVFSRGGISGPLLERNTRENLLVPDLFGEKPTRAVVGEQTQSAMPTFNRPPEPSRPREITMRQYAGGGTGSDRASGFSSSVPRPASLRGNDAASGSRTTTGRKSIAASRREGGA